MCVLPGDPSWIEGAAYLEDLCALLGSAAEVAETEGEMDRHVLPHLTYRIAENAIGRIRADVREGGRPTVHLVVVPAFELNALRDVLDVLRHARDTEHDATAVMELAEDFGQCFTPSRTAAAFTADLQRVLTVLTLDIPAGRSIATAFALHHTPGFDFDTAYQQLATAWKTAGITP
ncbi:hypothetical protein ACFYMW_36300 [Streptomyces sp. NPDC006692]|uniref:hypothetical protein n=1 Tax=unclassified Streptomyces TaxID=2593676 RepID=UPI00367EE947